MSRRTMAAGVVGSLLSGLSTRATQAGSEADPPVFATIRHQFVELEPQQMMPALRLPRLDGKAAILVPPPGQVMLLNFWATWCPSCRIDLPMLDRFQAEVGDQVRVAAVAIDREGASRVAPFARSLGIRRLAIYLDPDGRVARQQEADASSVPFPLYGMPITFVISASGRIGGYILGAADWSSEPARQLIAYYARR